MENFHLYLRTVGKNDADGSINVESDGGKTSQCVCTEIVGDPESNTGFSTVNAGWFSSGDFIMTGYDPNSAAEDKKDAVSNVVQRAEKDSGEDGGVAIPAAIAIGLLGTGAAVAAGAAASGAAAGTDGGAGSGESADDERKKKRYKMYIQKDFGDAIRKGADPVTVRA